MVLMAVQRLRVAMPDGPRALVPGETITLPDPVGQRLLEMVPEKVKVVESNVLCPGVWVEFFSPLFGMCTAKIHEVTLEGCIITNHSVLKGEGEPVTIPASWICGVYREQQASS